MDDAIVYLITVGIHLMELKAMLSRMMIEILSKAVRKLLMTHKELFVVVYFVGRGASAKGTIGKIQR